jgi:membrane fusion protein, multidrug efflux system
MMERAILHAVQRYYRYYRAMRLRPFGWALCALLLLTACSNQPTGAPAAQGTQGSAAVPVTVATAVQQAVPVTVRAVGTVKAHASVTVVPQVSGQLARVHFEEGQDVERGELLVTIDPRPFEARLKQAEATLARDLAQLENAQRDAARYAELLRRDAVSREEYDRHRAEAEALAATVRADRAAVEEARLELQYTSIKAPIGGRTGGLLVDAGNIVRANETALVVINQIEPIFMSFAVPEGQLPAIRAYQSQGALAVEAVSPAGGDQLGKGELTFIANQVDPATGTIDLKAAFANRERTLWPGQFVDVVMTLSVDPDAIVVPAEAVQTGQQGSFVFVVTPEHTVELRSVVVGREVDQRAVLAKGVAPGDVVVTDGHLRLVPGARVEIKETVASAAIEGGRA